MEKDKRQTAITRLTNIGIGELIDDSIMPRERFDPSISAKRPVENWADLPHLPIDHFDDKLLLSLFQLADSRNDYTKVKKDLKNAVNYRLHTKGQPFRKVGQLLYCDVNRLITQRSDEIHQERLRGERPPRPKKRGQMERAMARMNLGTGGDGQGDDVLKTEEKPVIDQHNSTTSEKRKRSGSDSSPARPSKLMHVEHTSEGMGLDLDGSGNGHGLSEKTPSTTMDPGRSFQECKDTSIAIEVEFKIFRKSVFATSETDVTRIDIYHADLDNLAFVLQQLSMNKLRASQYRVPITNGSEPMLAARVQQALTSLRNSLEVGTDELPGGNINIDYGWFMAQTRFEEANIAWQRRFLVTKAREYYEYLHQMLGLVLSDEVMSLFTNVVPEPNVQAAHPEGDPSTD